MEAIEIGILTIVAIVLFDKWMRAREEIKRLYNDKSEQEDKYLYLVRDLDNMNRWSHDAESEYQRLLSAYNKQVIQNDNLMHTSEHLQSTLNHRIKVRKRLARKPRIVLLETWEKDT